MSAIDFLNREFGLEKIDSKVAAGKYRGYHMIFKDLDDSNYLLEIGAFKEGENYRLPQLLDFLIDPKKGDLLNTAATIIFQIKKSMFGEKIEDTISRILENSIPILEQNEFKTGSFHSGIDDGTVRLVQIGQNHTYLTSSEFHQAFSEIEHEKEIERNTRENYVLGTLTTVIIAIAGALLYALIGKMGYYVFAVPFILTAGAYNAYKKVAKKTSMFSFFIIIILIALSILAGTFIEYVWHIYDAYKHEGVTLMEVIELLSELILNEPEIKSEYIKDISINGFVLLIAAVFMFIDIRKNELRYTDVKTL